MSLPIEDVLASLITALDARRRVVLEAPPGAGKTTRVPLALLNLGWLGGQKILMLEPRRLAARAAAAYMAKQLGEDVGQTVGYRVRFDTRVGSKTRIEVVTEGILTRMLQTDPTLEGVGIVIFDEFHERHLTTDLGLALALDAQAGLREDLRILVMSATLDGERLTRFLDAPLVSSAGRAFEVEIRYEPARSLETLEQTIRRVLARDLPSVPGDVLVFLPGFADIQRVLKALGSLEGADSIDLLALHGEMSPDEQDRALKPGLPGRRKIICASNVAESSVTLPGVRWVIDSGLAREMRFDPNRGFAELKTVHITQASATQRAGRAGREAPGVALRLWDRERRLESHIRPEILHADLAPLSLEVLGWGAKIEALCLLDAPPPGTLAQASGLLALLALSDADGRLNERGRKAVSSGLHPRWASAQSFAQHPSERAVLLDLQSLLEARDPLQGSARFEADMGLRLSLLADARGGRMPNHVNSAALRQIVRLSDEQRRRSGIKVTPSPADTDEAGRLATRAFPDRIGRHLGAGRYALSSGALAELDAQSRLRGEPWLVVLNLQPRSGSLLISHALKVSEDDLRRTLAEHISVVRLSEIDEGSGALRAFEEERLLKLTLSRRERMDLTPSDRLNALKDTLRRLGRSGLASNGAVDSLRARVELARSLRPELELPDLDDLEPLLDGLLAGKTRIPQISADEHLQALNARLSRSQRTRLDALFPTHLSVPSGSRKPLQYSALQVKLEVKLQELFGLSKTPQINDGRTLVTLHLLSPGLRPIQVTRDLKGFWERTYAEVKRELKGRYPRHPWPDNPLLATPTARAKPRGT